MEHKEDGIGRRGNYTVRMDILYEQLAPKRVTIEREKKISECDKKMKENREQRRPEGNLGRSHRVEHGSEALFNTHMHVHTRPDGRRSRMPDRTRAAIGCDIERTRINSLRQILDQPTDLC